MVREALVERALDIRLEVFVREQQVPLDEERDAYDAAAIHALLWQDGRAVATARMVIRPDRVAKIGRVAVRVERRGQGLGAALMQALHDEAARLRLSACLLDAQEAVCDFYAALGYVAEGERFVEAGIWHRRMRRRIE